MDILAEEGVCHRAEPMGGMARSLTRRISSPGTLANVHFQSAPNESPFDWALSPVSGAETLRNDGLEIRFSGTENVNFSNVRQFATVSGGSSFFGPDQCRRYYHGPGAFFSHFRFSKPWAPERGNFSDQRDYRTTWHHPRSSYSAGHAGGANSNRTAGHRKNSITRLAGRYTYIRCP